MSYMRCILYGLNLISYWLNLISYKLTLHGLNLILHKLISHGLISSCVTSSHLG